MARTHFYTCAMNDGFHLSLAAVKKLHAFVEIASVKWYFLLFFILAFFFSFNRSKTKRLSIHS